VDWVGCEGAEGKWEMWVNGLGKLGQNTNEQSIGEVSDLDLQYAVQHPAMRMAAFVLSTMWSIGRYILTTLIVSSIAPLPSVRLSNLTKWLIPIELFDPHLVGI